MDLHTYLHAMPMAQREAFAKRCETSYPHIRNIAYGKLCGEKLAVLIDRESNGIVPCESLRPDVDWAYLRGTAPRRRSTDLPHKPEPPEARTP